MAARRFGLPLVQDLSKDQERVRHLPLAGQHLIVGGPGTGKTVVALLRARQLARAGRDYCFLVFNHLLNKAAHQMNRGSEFGSTGALESKTWHSWLNAEFRSITGKELPMKESEGWKPIDWPTALRIANDTPCSVAELASDRFLVIDEGQDMPPEFYQCVVGLGFENLFVCADQNQQITKEHSSRLEIQTALALKDEDVVELRHNFRNKYPVARLASEFRTQDPASPPPDLPNAPSRPSAADAPIYFKYDPKILHLVVKRVLGFYDRNPNHLVGVIAPRDKVRQNFLDELQRQVDSRGREAGVPPVATFWGTHRPDVRFDKGGILVINVQACKGLEFDVVVCADINEHFINPKDHDSVRKTFYVMVSRARERVVMLMPTGDDVQIEEILPRDAGVLSWKQGGADGG